MLLQRGRVVFRNHSAHTCSHRIFVAYGFGMIREKYYGQEAHGSADHITVIDNKNGLRQRRLPAEVTAYAGEHLVTYATVPAGTRQAYTGIALLT
jgi:hypothetical protein